LGCSLPLAADPSASFICSKTNILDFLFRLTQLPQRRRLGGRGFSVFVLGGGIAYLMKHTITADGVAERSHLSRCSPCSPISDAK
jgi:hypothetical protein